VQAGIAVTSAHTTYDPFRLDPDMLIQPRKRNGGHADISGMLLSHNLVELM